MMRQHRVACFLACMVLVLVSSTFLFSNLDTKAIRTEFRDEKIEHNQQHLDGLKTTSLPNRNSGNTTGVARNSLPNGPKTYPRPNLTDDRLQRFLVIPEYKLLFCFVEKVGCSMFNHLFRMLRIHHPDVQKRPGELKFQAGHTWMRNIPRAHGIKTSQLEDMLADPNWTKALFYRDPVFRFLSSFRNTCEGSGFNRCTKLFKTSTFNETLEFLELHGLPDDNHFAPMSGFCGGLGNTIDYYDFVHELDRRSAAMHVAALFDRIGVGKEATLALVDRIVRSGGTDIDQDIEYVTKFGAQLGYGVTQEKSHVTSASTHVCRYFDTREKVRLIEELYNVDYNTFGFVPRKLNCTYNNDGS